MRLASRAPCDLKTLARAARDHVQSHPTFAVGAGQLEWRAYAPRQAACLSRTTFAVGAGQLEWLARGYGYEVTGADVLMAFEHTLVAVEQLGSREQTRAAIRQTAEQYHGGTNLVTSVLRHRLQPGAPTHTR